MQDENWQYYSLQRQEETLEENQAEAVDLSWCAFLCALPCIPPTRGPCRWDMSCVSLWPADLTVT